MGYENEEMNIKHLPRVSPKSLQMKSGALSQGVNSRYLYYKLGFIICTVLDP